MLSPLHLAAADPNGFNLVKQYIEINKFNAYQLDETGMLPFEHAVKSGSIETVVYLHELDIQLNSSLFQNPEVSLP